MKKILLFMFIGAFLNSEFVYAQGRGPKYETVFVPFIKTPKPHPHPRSVSVIPFDCFYVRSSIYINFCADIGDVYVTIINNSTGEQWYDVVDSSMGHVEIAISDSSGNYSVTLDTEYAGIYTGGFSH